MILSRHTKNPPDEVMFSILRPKLKRYSNLYEHKIARIIEEETGVNPLHTSIGKGKRVVQPRQLFMVFMVRTTPLIFETIGAMVGRDHSTVTHSLKTINNLCDTEILFKKLYDRIDAKIKNLK